jgi:Uma2 family endonuclease
MAANLKNIPRHLYTLEEYFALERASEARYEYWDGEIICMSGGSLHHAIISDNLHGLLRELLRGKNCRAFSGTIPIKTPSRPPYRYPDASVVCGPVLTEKIGGIDALTNPVVVVEVLSPGTEQLDKEEKREACQKLASVREYLLVAQDAPHVTQYGRQGRRWVRRDYGDLQASVELASIDQRLLMGDIYEGVTFS